MKEFLFRISTCFSWRVFHGNDLVSAIKSNWKLIFRENGWCEYRSLYSLAISKISENYYRVDVTRNPRNADKAITKAFFVETPSDLEVECGSFEYYPQ